jgi:DNA polymerase-3 subunit epsilon
MICIREFNEDTDRTQLHVFENWCYLGTAQDEAGLEEIAQADTSPRFDPDIYNLLQKSLNETLEVICLGHASRRSKFLNGY